MDEAERYARVKQLVAAALELPDDERVAFLHANEADPQLRQRAVDLLAGASGTSSFLERPALMAGTSFAGYSLIRLAGSGGSSLVFEALQAEPERRVALKLLVHQAQPGSAQSSERWRRFRAEGELLAHLDHPGIARVIEAGELGEGAQLTRFIAVEWIAGARTLTDFAREEQLETAACVALIEEVAEAVAHTHRRGIVHRDLKPGNVLVDSDGKVRVIDFGVARWLDGGADAATSTRHGFLGTLAYASPEQCAGDPRLIGPETDVHAIGLLLYELLCGAPPYDIEGRSITDAIDAIRTAMPERPRARRGGLLVGANSQLARDLEAIVMMCLAKDPRARYADADALLLDLKRFASDRPVVARPPSLGVDLRLFLRRHRGPALLGAGMLAALAIAMVSVTLYLARAREFEREAHARAQETTDFVVSLLSFANPREQSPEELSVRALLDRATQRLAEHPLEDVRAAVELHATLGNSYRELALHAQAIEHFEHAVSLLASTEEVEPLYRIGTLNSFGHALIEAGELDRAVSVLEEASNLERNLTPAQPWLQAITSSQLARAHAARGEFEVAASCAEFAHETYTREFGARHRSVARALNTLVEVDLSRGELTQAEARAEQALELDMENHGEEALVTARSRFILARVAREMGDTQRAAREARAAITTYSALLDAEHPKRTTAEEFLRQLQLETGE